MRWLRNFWQWVQSMSNWETIHIPLAKGMQQLADERALEPPSLAVCEDAVFDEVGGIQERNEFATGTVSSPGTIKRLAVHGDTLLAFTKDKLYAWVEYDGGDWIEVDDHLACTISESDEAYAKADQDEVDCAELSGVRLWSWIQGGSSPELWLVALDAGTGQVIAGPYQDTSLTTPERIRVLAFNTRFIVFAYDGGATPDAVYYKAIHPTTGLTGSTTGFGIESSFATGLSAGYGDISYDVRRIDGTDTAAFVYNTSTTAYAIRTISGAGGGAPTLGTESAKARDCRFAVAVATLSDGACIVFRAEAASALRADILDTSLADTGNVDVSIGTHFGDVPWMTAAFEDPSDSGGGTEVAHVLYSDTSAPFRRASIQYGGTVDQSMETLLGTLKLCSHAFSHDGRVYAWAAYDLPSAAAGDLDAASGFTSKLQASYFLIRDDGQLFAKALANVASTVSTSYNLPSVQSLGSNQFLMPGIQKRRITVGEDSSDAYAERSPARVVLEFDDNKARTMERLGRTSYLPGAQVVQFDGSGLYEVGFHYAPDYISGTFASSGNLTAGDYVYFCTYLWTNATGDTERSATLSYGKGTATASQKLGTVVTRRSAATRKKDANNAIAVELWRSQVNPTPASPFFLASDPNPENTSGANAYVANATDGTSASLSLADDELSDTALAGKEASQLLAGVLQPIAPSAATILFAGANRICLAGAPRAPGRIYYSKLWPGPGEVVSFNDQLFVDLPSEAGAVTAGAFLNETLVAFTATAVYTLPGVGFDNTGGGQNYGPARRIAIDVGALYQDAIGVIPEGILFQSQKGWHLLDRSWSVRYVGAPIADYDGDTVLAVHSMPSKHQVRVVTDSRVLVWDQRADAWSEWNIASPVSSVLWNGSHVISNSSGSAVLVEDTTSRAGNLDIEIPWIKTADIQGFAKGRFIRVLGETVSTGKTLRVRIAYDYDDSSWTDDKTWTISPDTAGAPLRVRHRFSQPRCEAFKVRLTAPTGGIKLTALSVEYKPRRGLPRNMPAAQTQ